MDVKTEKRIYLLYPSDQTHQAHCTVKPIRFFTMQSKVSWWQCWVGKAHSMTHKQNDYGSQHTREYTARCSLRHARSVTYHSLSTGSNELLHRIKRWCYGKWNRLTYHLSYYTVSSFLLLNWITCVICLCLWIYIGFLRNISYFHSCH